MIEDGATLPPGPAAPFVEVKATVFAEPVSGLEPARETIRMRFVPATGLMRNEAGLWHRPDRRTAALLHDAADELAPFGARVSLAAWLGGLLAVLTRT